MKSRMEMSGIVTAVAVLGATLFLQSCGGRAGSAIGPTQAGANAESSSLTDLDVQLPDRTGLKAKVPDIETKMNGYHLTVQASGCSNGKNVSQVGDYKNSEKINASLVQGCDHVISIALGNKDAGGVALKAVYFKSIGASIKKEAIVGQTSINVPLGVDLTDEGKAIGLGSTTSPQPIVSPIPNVSPQPNPTNTPIVNTEAQLAAEKDASLKYSAGKTSKLSAEFKGKYLVLDFSSIGCPPCVAMAERFNQDTAKQKMFDGTVCSHATLIPGGDISGWSSRFGNTPVGQHSWAVDGGSTNYAANKLNSPITATPTVLVIDRSGKVVARAVGSYPSEISSLCSGS